MRLPKDAGGVCPVDGVMGGRDTWSGASMTAQDIEACTRWILMLGAGVEFGLWQHSASAGEFAFLCLLLWTNLWFRK